MAENKTSAAQLRAARKWQRENEKSRVVKFYPSHAHLLAHLDAQENKSDYMRRLIAADMEGRVAWPSGDEPQAAQAVGVRAGGEAQEGEAAGEPRHTTRESLPWAQRGVIETYEETIAESRSRLERLRERGEGSDYERRRIEEAEAEIAKDEATLRSLMRRFGLEGGAVE